MELTYTKLAYRQVHKLERDDIHSFNIVMTKIEGIKRGIYKGKRLTSKRKLYRLRGGDYRIVYSEENGKLIIVEMVEKRSRVYRRIK